MMRFSRLFLVIGSLLMCSPLIAGLMQPRGNGRSAGEARPLSRWPAWPHRATEWRALPNALDAFLADHFGLRDPMIHLQSAIAYRWLDEANPDVLIGRNRRLFYYGNDAVAQSAGVTFRPDLIDHTVDVLTDMQKVLSAQGIRLLAGAPPNAASIYDDDLPGWARRQGRETEPDRILTLLKARGLLVVDLSRALRSARDQGNLYLRTDTHWTPLGTLIGFNAVAAAAGHSDWTMEASRIMAPPTSFESGDLARMLGADGDWQEVTQDWTLPDAAIEAVGPPDAPLEITEAADRGPAVLIIGDSFTEASFADLAGRHVRKIGWLHSANCGFDWSWIAAFKPDEVWWLPTERLMLCNSGTRPQGMPHPSDSDDQTGRIVTRPGARPSGGQL